MSVALHQRSDLDLFAAEVIADPYPHFAELRELGSAVWMEKLDAWAITRYDAIRAVLADPARFSSKRVALNDAMNAALVGTPLSTDPPRHQPLREATMRSLSPRALRPAKARIDQQADEMVAKLVQRGSFDAMEDLARALPLTVVVDLIGVKGEIREKVLPWGEAGFDCLGPMNELSGRAFEVSKEFFNWVNNITAADLEEGSMGHAIFADAARGDFPLEDCNAIVHQYIGAGMDTTIASIGYMVALFAENPDQFDLVRADRSLVPAAYNEVLRCASMVQAFGRHVNEDVEIDGTLVPEGSQVALLFGSGNHDPRHYSDPERFLVERNPIDHLTFGYGMHTCAGQGLARLEAHAVIDALARRVKRLHIGRPEQRVTNMLRTYETLPVIEIEVEAA